MKIPVESSLKDRMPVLSISSVAAAGQSRELNGHWTNLKNSGEMRVET